MSAAFDAFQEHVRGQKLDPALASAPVVAVLHGPAVVIEAVIRKACENSGLVMYWSYSGGRAFVQSYADRDKARSAIKSCLPGSDIGRDEF